jgi:hypothetical protein
MRVPSCDKMRLLFERADQVQREKDCPGSLGRLTMLRVDFSASVVSMWQSELLATTVPRDAKASSISGSAESRTGQIAASRIYTFLVSGRE